jgi:demethylmenaquinone methyltransferase/2-methoxy-6-polyprenyl-1,4-benzoquinol methylase
LDLASGTGDLALALTSRGAFAVGVDVTHRMLQLARGKAATGNVRRSPAFVTGDMCALPFPSDHFDVVTTGYGLRNVPDLRLAIAETFRVLRAGGTLVSLDFNRPENALVRGVYLGYLWAVGGALGWVLHRDPDTYRYIPASIRRYPGAGRVTELLRSEGFSHAEWIPVLGGLVSSLR